MEEEIEITPTANEAFAVGQFVDVKSWRTNPKCNGSQNFQVLPETVPAPVPSPEFKFLPSTEYSQRLKILKVSSLTKALWLTGTRTATKVMEQFLCSQSTDPVKVSVSAYMCLPTYRETLTLEHQKFDASSCKHHDIEPTHITRKVTDGCEYVLTLSVSKDYSMDPSSDETEQLLLSLANHVAAGRLEITSAGLHIPEKYRPIAERVIFTIISSYKPSYLDLRLQLHDAVNFFRYREKIEKSLETSVLSVTLCGLRVPKKPPIQFPSENIMGNLVNGWLELSLLDKDVKIRRKLFAEETSKFAYFKDNFELLSAVIVAESEEIMKEMKNIVQIFSPLSADSQPEKTVPILREWVHYTDFELSLMQKSLKTCQFFEIGRADLGYYRDNLCAVVKTGGVSEGIRKGCSSGLRDCSVVDTLKNEFESIARSGVDAGGFEQIRKMSLRFRSRFFHYESMNDGDREKLRLKGYPLKIGLNLLIFRYEKFVCNFEDTEKILDCDSMQISGTSVPQYRACPRCLNLKDSPVVQVVELASDAGSKCATCTRCKFNFCFVCLSPQVSCQKTPCKLQSRQQIIQLLERY